jgi:phosphoglycerol transferase MdoB-like AlkP superfamily enzyme
MTSSFNRSLSPPSFIKYIFSIYLLGIVFFTLFRVGAFFIHYQLLLDIPATNRFSLTLQSLSIGFRFDTVISMYLLALPLLVLFVNALFNNNRYALKTIKWFINSVFFLVLFLCAADIPFFNHFNYRINSASLMWAESTDMVISMIAQDPSYWGVLVPFALVILVFFKLHTRFIKRFFVSPTVSISWLKNSIWFLVSGGVCFLALRGTVDFNRSPLNAKDAYFSNYSILNQMALSPVYTFLKSMTEQQKSSNADLDLMESDKAFEEVRKQLNRTYLNNNSLATLHRPDSQHITQPNVVLVLMEGLSAAKLASYGDTNNCTPYLDTLIQQSYFFNNAYSAGLHTHNGIYSSITSFPALFERHGMTQIPILRYNNLISTLRDHDYQTIYFSNHDVEFDNVGGFLVENGIQQMVSERDYDLSKKLSVWGVPDDYMFDFSIPYLNKLAANKKPFFGLYMTTSNHRPFRFPENYQRRFESDENEGAAYADWSIEQWMEKVKKEDWFENTLFVFMSDHGWAIKPRYDIPLNYVHVPLFFYSPKYFPAAITNDKLAAQIDVFPTIMSALKLPYTQTDLGVDLFSNTRPYVYFNADDKLGVLNKNYYYIYRKNGPESLYEIPRLENILDENKAIADSMKNYAFSQMQVSHDLIQKNRVGKPGTK